MTQEQLQAQRIKDLEAQLAKMQAQNARSLSIKHSEFGGGTVMVTGLGRHPLSLYPKQWKTLKDIGAVDKALKYAEENAEELRAAAYAKEKCSEANLEFVAGKKNDEFKERYLTFKTIALKDRTLSASKWDN